MATKKLQDLAASINPNDSDIFIIEDATATKKITFANMFSKIKQKLGNALIESAEREKWNGYKNTLDELNRNMQSTNTQLIPKTIFTGSRDINDKNIWNDTLSFADFSTVRFTFSFQNQVGIFDVRPMHDDNLVHAVSYGFNSNDDVARLLFGRIKFSGRYITKAEFKLSYGLAKPEAITSGIYVVNIVGFNY